MAEYWNEDLDDDDADVSQGDGPEGLRKAHRASVRENKALKKQIEDLTTQLGTLSGQVRAQSLSELLQAKGVAPKVAQFYPKDAEVDETAVTKWIDDFKDVFNFQVADTGNAQGADAGSQDQAGQQDTAQADQDNLAALHAALNAGAGGTAVPSSAAASLVADVERNAKTEQDVYAILAKHGIEVKQGY